MILILYVRNNKERAIKSIQSVLDMIENAPLIVVDNASEDGFSEWASGRSNFDYIYMDEGYQPIGRVMNQVIEAIGIDDDIIFIDSNDIIMPECIESLLNTFDSDDSLAAVGCVTNHSGDLINQSLQEYDELAQYVNAISDMRLNNTYTAMIGGDVCLVRNAAYKTIGGFDENLEVFDNCMKDFSLKALEKGYRVIRDRNALAFDMRDEMEKYGEINEDEKLRARWGIHYLGMNPNMDVVELVEADENVPLRILEIGCDCGATLVSLKERYPNAKIYGTDINPNSVRVASYILDDARTDNIEDYKLDFGINNFDYIIFADVLEHLRNPQGTLEFCKGLLKENGKIVSSIPNLMNISVMKDLLDGNFTYTEIGLLDKTHIHMFTYNEIIRTFNDAGLYIDNMRTVSSIPDAEENMLIDTLLSLSGKTARHMYETFQYLVIASKV